MGAAHSAGIAQEFACEAQIQKYEYTNTNTQIPNTHTAHPAEIAQEF